jgi:hypothetical protein
MTESTTTPGIVTSGGVSEEPGNRSVIAQQIDVTLTNTASDSKVGD